MAISSSIKRLLPKSITKFLVNIKRIYYLDYREILYSQSGEDGILKGCFFEELQIDYKGKYIDIGCYHPFLSSNTHFFYLRGWRGINIDVNPNSIKLFNKIRKEDINLNIAIWPSGGNVFFYYNKLNPGMSYVSDKNRINNKETTIKKIISQPLHQVLSSYVKDNERIDFMTIDVEGNELAILKSNDWSKFRPSILVIEILGINHCEIKDNDTSKYLSSIGYSLLTFSILKSKAYSVFYIDSNYKKNQEF